LRLIAVEDSLLVREGLVELPRSRGHDVLAVAATPSAVPPLVRTHGPDVVLVDIKLPPTFTDEGLQLASAIRARYERVAVLVLSQYLVAGYAARLLDESPERVGYLLKDNVVRAEALDVALRRGGRRRELRGPPAVVYPDAKRRADGRAQ